MPYINVRSNAAITPQQEEKIKAFLGMCISFIPGKSENWLMVEIEGGKNLYFKGEKTTPSVYIDFKILGTLDRAMCKKITGLITKNISETLGVNPMNIYICFMSTQYWGWSSDLL